MSKVDYTANLFALGWLFDLIDQVDFCLLNDVQFQKQTWQHRNKILQIMVITGLLSPS